MSELCVFRLPMNGTAVVSLQLGARAALIASVGAKWSHYAEMIVDETGLSGN